MADLETRNTGVPRKTTRTNTYRLILAWYAERLDYYESSKLERTIDHNINKIMIEIRISAGSHRYKASRGLPLKDERTGTTG